MRKKRDPETSEHRQERPEAQAREQTERAAAEQAALDAAVRRSIQLYGA